MLARNVISASVRAGISGATIDTRASGGAAGAVDVLALGLSRINAVVLGMSASVSVSQYAAASASIGVAMAENVIGYDVNSAGQVVALGAGRPVNEIAAFIDRSAVTAGAVSVDARNVSFKANGDVDRKQSIDAVVVAGAVAVSVAYAPPSSTAPAWPSPAPALARARSTRSRPASRRASATRTSRTASRRAA